tara:strand:- start:1311 stop:1499 length:189 start_codon:yes stop_codon:yes gene_type:complete
LKAGKAPTQYFKKSKFKNWSTKTRSENQYTNRKIYQSLIKKYTKYFFQDHQLAQPAQKPDES